MNTGDPASSLFVPAPPSPFPSPPLPHASSTAPSLSASASFSLPSSSSFSSLPASPSLSGSWSQSQSQSQSLAPDVDLSSIYPVSPFDSVCLKHMRRYLQGYDRVYTKMLMEYGAERSRVNQQHWERVHRLQQQQQQKVQRFHRDHSQQHESSSSTASKHRHEEESKTREEEDEEDAGEQQLDYLSSARDAEDDEKAASMRQHKAEASAAESEREREKVREQERREMSEAELASMESEYREMKTELDAFHTACLSDANRRFRSMIISLTQRVDHFLSMLVSPSQLLQDVDVTLHVRSAATGRAVTAQFTVRCVETFSDLRRRFVHWMREEQGDAVLAFTPDSQFLLPHGEVNASCRTNIQHCFTRQQPQQHAPSSSSSGKQPPLRPPAPAPPAHANSAHYSAYQSLSRPLAAFRARATRARAGYALKISGVEEESTAAGGSAEASHTASTLVSPPSPQSTGSNSQSRSGQSVAASSSFSVSAADPNVLSAAGLPASATWSSPSSSFSSSPVLGPARPPSSSSPSPSLPILILDEDIALVNFIADGVTSLTVDLLGAVVLVSDQAANASRASTRPRRGTQQSAATLAHSNHNTSLPAAAQVPASASSSSSSLSSPASALPPPVPYHFHPSRALGSIAASASRLPARILPNVRQHLAAAPPLPKLPPAITAFFHRHAHPHNSGSSPPHAPDTPVAAASSARDAAGDAALNPTSWDAVLVEAAGADAAAASAGQAGDRVPVSPPADSGLTVSSASEDSGSSEDSVQHVSLTHSVSMSVNPIDDADEMDEELMANHLHLMQQQQQHHVSTAGGLQQAQPQHQQQQQHLRPPLRARHHSHPLAFPSAGSASAPSPSASMSRYPHHRLSVEVEADAGDRIDSVMPSQSFSGVSIPFIDYDMEAEDSRLAERSVTETESSSVLRMHDELDDDEDGGINSTGGSTGAVTGGRLRSQYGSSADASAEVELNGTRLQHSHSFSHSSFQSTPSSALPTPSVSRPQSATLDLLSAGVLHLPRSQPPALPSSLPSSTGSPFPLTTSPPASLHALNPLMMSPSPNDSSNFLQPLSMDSRRSQ